MPLTQLYQWLMVTLHSTLILKGLHGRIVVLKNGRYDNVPIDVVTSSKKIVKVSEHYNTERLRPYYHSFEMKPFLLMASDN